VFLLILALAPPASACGGFFCSAAAPIDQAAEEIVFAMDEDEGIVEMHIDISYEGRSEDFAWILPVPEEPELFVSSTLMFNALSAATVPTFTLTYREDGRCSQPSRSSWGCATEYSIASPNVQGIANPGGVDVVDTERIGPYDTVTLRADSTTELMSWLVDNEYDLPQDLEPLLTQYIAEDSHFVAMRMAAGTAIGDIEPIGLRYAADALAIPIQLTAVAAADDMPLRVYVLGRHRAVPESYLHVQINEAAVDWRTGGGNYADILGEAIDEAGGLAFVTEYAGTSENVIASADSILADLIADFPYLTRLTTELSAGEMSLDPTFVFNRDLPDVAKDHVAERVMDCDTEDNLQHIELSDGRFIYLGGNPNLGNPSDGLLEDLQDIPALVVEDTSDPEKPVVIADFWDDALDALDQHSRPYEPKGQCSCATTVPMPLSMAYLWLLVVFVRRRRH